MALMLGKLYRALMAGGAPEPEAREAAEEVAGFGGRLAGLDTDMRLLKWMAGANFALSVAIFIKLFVH
jgi:hypothetical protein